MIACKRCGNDFEQQPWQVRSGDLRCDECHRLRYRERRAKRTAEGRPINKSAAYVAEYGAVYYRRPEVKRRRAVAMRKYASDPKLRPRHEARWAAQKAIESGKLVRQPCEACGVAKTDAHHDDYGRPLDVRWLCRKHHAEHHRAAARKPEEGR